MKFYANLKRWWFFLNLNLDFFLDFIIFSNSNFTFYDLRLLSEKFTFSINFIVKPFTIYEFYEKLRLIKYI